MSERAQDRAGVYKCESKRLQGEFGLCGFSTFCSSSTSPFSPWKGLCSPAPAQSSITVSHGSRSERLGLGCKLWRDSARWPPPASFIPPAHAWQDEIGNTETVRASLRELFPLSKTLHPVQDKAAMGPGWEGLSYERRSAPLRWVMSRLNGGSGCGNNEGIHFESALAGRRGNKMDKRSCCRLPAHSWKGTDTYMLEIRCRNFLFLGRAGGRAGWRGPDTGNHYMWKGLWQQLLIPGHSREWKYQQAFEEQSIRQKGAVCYQKERLTKKFWEYSSCRQGREVRLRQLKHLLPPKI